MIKVKATLPPVPTKPAKDKETKKEKTMAALAAPKGTAADIIATIHATKGVQAVVTGNTIPVVPRQATGVFEFDFNTGGGFPRGRYSIVFGPWSSGKTNITYKAIAAAQRTPKPKDPNAVWCNKAVYVNIEQTFDPIWAALMGVDVEALIVINGAYGEETVDLIDALVRAEDVAILVADSVAALIGSKEIASSTEVANVGGSSVLVTRLVNKLMCAFGEEARRKHYPCVILVNQVRYKIGVSFGDPEYMPGGEALKFLASLIVRLQGKNVIVATVNPNVPCLKDTHAVIKKAKVPVINVDFNYRQVMYAHNGLEIGDTDSWNLVVNFLKSLGELIQKPKGWEILGVLYPKQAAIAEHYNNDVNFRIQLQKIVIDAYSSTGTLVDPPPEPQHPESKMPGTPVKPWAAAVVEDASA